MALELNFHSNPQTTQLEHIPSPVRGSGSSPVCGGGAYLSCVVSVKTL